MICYGYDIKTKEYTGEEIAYLDPLESQIQGKEIYALPANSTFKKPTTTKEHEVACFNENKNKWEIKADYRGSIYYKKDTKEQITINEIGIKPDNTMTDIEPIDNDCVWNEETNSWIIPFDILKQRKLNEMAKARQNEIENTGMEYTHYDDDNPKGLDVIVDTDTKAQTSITGQASASKLALEMGAEDTSTAVLWKFRNQIWGYFSYTGFIQFSLFVCDWIEKRYAKEKLLVNRINECTTEEELKEINWNDIEPNK